MKQIGIYLDPIINRHYALYTADAKTLSDDLKGVYKKQHGVPNVRDFANNSNNASDNNLFKYENNFIALITKNGDLDNLDGAVLIDGYRRLFLENAPTVQTFVKVYGAGTITLADEIKLMMEFNYWKKFNKDRSSFFERGFALWIYLKSGVNINTILDPLQSYLHYRDFFNDDKNPLFDTIFFDNLNLFGDVKFIRELKKRIVSFTIGKKQYTDMKIPLAMKFITTLGELRAEHKTYAKIDIDKFYADILDNEPFKQVTLEFNEAMTEDKKERCRDKALDFLLNYIRSEYFGAEHTKTVIEIQEDNKARLETIKKTHTLLQSVKDRRSSFYYAGDGGLTSRLAEELKNVTDLIQIKGYDMNKMGTNMQVNNLVFLGTKTKTNSNATPYTVFCFRNIDTAEVFEHSAGYMAREGKFYIPKAAAPVRETQKRQPFVIYGVHASRGGTNKHYYIKAKTTKRALELAEEHSDLLISASYLKNYCYNLTTQSKAIEATKNIEEGIIEYNER